LPFEYNQAVDGAQIGPRSGSCGTAAFLRRRVVVSDIEHDPLWTDYREIALRHNLRSCWSEPVIDSHGQVVGTFAMYHTTVCSPLPEDISFIRVAAHLAGIAIERERAEKDRLRLEQERNESQRRLVEARRMESLGLLAGGIAHDFNNLLTVILGNAGLLRLELAHDQGLQGMLGDIELAGERAAELCRQMLAYAGKGRVEIGSVDISGLVRESARLLEVSAGKQVQVEFDVADALPMVQADATQLRQILMNLVINASEALGATGGRIRVVTGVHDKEMLSEEWLIQPEPIPLAGTVYLEVQDNGPGMSEEVLARIFDPFFTTKFTGRGLGLSAVLGMVRAHRGVMCVRTLPGKGATFRLSIPSKAAPGAGGEAVPLAEPSTSSTVLGAGVVLVIDDEEGVRAVSTRMVEAFGFRVESARDGEEGLRLLEHHVGAYRMVLLDLTMPGLGGEEVFRRIRQRFRDIPILLMSGYTRDDATRNLRQFHRAGFIQKPFNPSELREAVKSLLA